MRLPLLRFYQPFQLLGALYILSHFDHKTVFETGIRDVWIRKSITEAVQREESMHPPRTLSNNICIPSLYRSRAVMYLCSPSACIANVNSLPAAGWIISVFRESEGRDDDMSISHPNLLILVWSLWQNLRKPSFELHCESLCYWAFVKKWSKKVFC